MYSHIALEVWLVIKLRCLMVSSLDRFSLNLRYYNKPSLVKDLFKI